MTTAQTDTDYVTDPRRWRVLAVLSTALFMSLISVSIVNVALPSIQIGLDASDSALQWVLSGYALTFGVGLVMFGRAGDLMGRGPLFVAGVVIFTGASAWCGIASDALWLNIARAVAGIGSGLISPQAVGMIQQYFRGRERGVAFGIFGAVVGVSVAIGPVLGGLLIAAGGAEHGWRWVFFVNIPFGIAAVALALTWFPRPMWRDRRSAAPGERDLDVIGALLLGASVFALLLPFVEAELSAWIWAALPIGAGLLWTWVRWEARYARLGRSPMVNLGIFRVRSFTNGVVIVGLYFLGMTSVWVLVALYFQYGMGRSALETGMLGLPSSILSGIAALWAGRLVAQYGRLVVIIGLYSGLVGVALTITVAHLNTTVGMSEWWLVVPLSFIGIAQGAVISPNQALTLAEVPLDYAGSSGGIMQTVQRMGTSIGIAVITAIAFAVLATSDWSVAFEIGFVVIGVIIAIAVVIAHRDQRSRGDVVLL